MTEEEFRASFEADLKEYLKKNLSISVRITDEFSGRRLKVELILENEVISEDYDTVFQ